MSSVNEVNGESLQGPEILKILWRFYELWQSYDHI